MSIFLSFSPSPKWTMKLGTSYAGIFYECGFSLYDICDCRGKSWQKNTDWLFHLISLGFRKLMSQVQTWFRMSIFLQGIKFQQRTVQIVRVAWHHECSWEKGLFVTVSLLRSAGSSSITSSPAAPFLPALLGHSPRQWRLYGCKFLHLYRDCFLHLEFPSLHLYLLISMYSSRSRSMTIFSFLEV